MLVVAGALVLSSCSAARGPTSAPPSPSPAPAGRAAPTAPSGAQTFLPPPDERIPRRAGALAAELARVTRALMRSIDDWVQGRQLRPARPPRPVVLQALYQNRIYGSLADRPRLASRVLGHLPTRLARSARANVDARVKLRSLVTPLPSPRGFRVQRPEPAGRLLRFYKKAERRFSLDWQVLAAVNFVETKFGKVKSASTAGAQGPMQFIPSTWAAYGLGGDVRDPHDAILGAANYLDASGAPTDYRSALFAYNRSTAYVDAVLLYAEEIMKDRRNYFAYYNWPVFVLTEKGEKRLTGPGADR